MLMKIQFDDQIDEKARIKISFSDKEKDAELCKCHSLSKNLTICFYKEFVAFYDISLRCTNKIDWCKMLQFDTAELLRHSITQNFSSTQIYSD